MRNPIVLFTVIAILFSAGCQQSQKDTPKSVSSIKKEKLMTAENISLKAEIDKNKKELDNLNKSIAAITQENEKLKADNNNLSALQTKYEECTKSLADIKQQLAASQDMLESKDAPELCKAKIEQQQKLLAECKKEKQRIEKEAEENTTFLMQTVPDDLMKQVQTLTEENEKLKAKIAELEKPKN
jgi:chromosome segregation ATPase